MAGLEAAIKKKKKEAAIKKKEKKIPGYITLESLVRARLQSTDYTTLCILGICAVEIFIIKLGVQ